MLADYTLLLHVCQTPEWCCLFRRIWEKVHVCHVHESNYDKSCAQKFWERPARDLHRSVQIWTRQLTSNYSEGAAIQCWLQGGCNWCRKVNTDDRNTSEVGMHEHTQTAQDSDCAVFLKWGKSCGCKQKLNSVLAIIWAHVLSSLFNRVYWIVALSLMVEMWSWLFRCFHIPLQFANANFYLFKSCISYCLSIYGSK